MRTHTHTRLTALFPGLPRWAATRKVKKVKRNVFSLDLKTVTESLLINFQKTVSDSHVTYLLKHVWQRPVQHFYNIPVNLVKDAAKQQCRVGSRSDKWTAGSRRRSTAWLLHSLPCHPHLVTAPRIFAPSCCQRRLPCSASTHQLTQGALSCGHLADMPSRGHDQSTGWRINLSTGQWS